MHLRPIECSRFKTLSRKTHCSDLSPTCGHDSASAAPTPADASVCLLMQRKSRSEASVTSTGPSTAESRLRKCVQPPQVRHQRRRGDLPTEPPPTAELAKICSLRRSEALVFFPSSSRCWQHQQHNIGHPWNQCRHCRRFKRALRVVDGGKGVPLVREDVQ